jgi:hypothetical protein
MCTLHRISRPALRILAIDKRVCSTKAPRTVSQRPRCKPSRRLRNAERVRSSPQNAHPSRLRKATLANNPAPPRITRKDHKYRQSKASNRRRRRFSPGRTRRDRGKTARSLAGDECHYHVHDFTFALVICARFVPPPGPQRFHKRALLDWE